MKLKSPKVIKEYLDKYVVSQEAAKKILSTTVFAHTVKSLAHQSEDKKIPKSVPLIYGPTGCGKTYMIKTLCAGIGLPYINISAKDITAEGWKGDSVRTVLKNYIYKSATPEMMESKNFTDLQYGVIHIDEFDKICQGGDDDQISQHNKQQQELWLNFIEGFEYELNLNSPFGTVPYLSRFDTSNLLIVLTGSFAHLDKYLEENKDKRTIGFSSEDSNVSPVLQDQLVECGMSRELIGRVSTVTRVNELTDKDLRSIIENSHGTYLVYKQLFDSIIDIKFSNKKLNKIAKQAKDTNTGARAIHALVEKEIYELLYDVDLSFIPELEEEIENNEPVKEDEDEAVE